MSRRKRLMAIMMIASLVVSGVPVTAYAEDVRETTIADAPDLSDAEAAELVKKAFEKYHTHRVVSYLLETPSDNSYYAYDFEDDIGIAMPEYTADFLTIHECGTEFTWNDWYDFKNATRYETYFRKNKTRASTFYPLTKAEIGEYRTRYFGDIIEGRDKSFPEALEYQYAGKVWEYGPDQSRHVCYQIEVPESDASLYLEDEDYLPKMIYIGVDDGEVYRIDEQRYSTSEMETTYTNFHTHFSYPESIRVPKDILKKSKLSDEYAPSYKGVDYYQENSLYEKNSIGFIAYQRDYESKSFPKKIAIPDTINVRGKKYRIEGLSSGCFFKDDMLESITIGNYVKEMGDETFVGCRKLKSVTIGKRIESIGADAFRDCNKLKIIRIKNKKMRKYARSKKGRKKLGIRKTVKIK